jgi:hypothetical protein
MESGRSRSDEPSASGVHRKMGVLQGPPPERSGSGEVSRKRRRGLRSPGEAGATTIRVRRALNAQRPSGSSPGAKRPGEVSRQRRRGLCNPPPGPCPYKQQGRNPTNPAPAFRRTKS